MNDRSVNRASVVIAMTILTMGLATGDRQSVAEFPAILPPPILTTLPVLTLPPDAEPTARTPEEPEDSTVETDLVGNDIESAVATYKINGSGSLYELHSPETEIPRLGTPKS